MNTKYVKAELGHVTITLYKVNGGNDPYPFYVHSRENTEHYIDRWYRANFETFAEAMDDFAQIVKEAEQGERPWGTGGNLAGALSR